MSCNPLLLIIVGRRTSSMLLVYLIEQEMKVSQCGIIEIKIVAKFLHALPCNEFIVGASQKSGCEYFLRLENKRRHTVKRIISNRGIGNNGMRNIKRNIIARVMALGNKIPVPEIPVNILKNSSPTSATNCPVSESTSRDSTGIIPTCNNEPLKYTGSHPPPKNRNVDEAAAWLRKYFPAYESTFVNYSGIDLLNLTRQELVNFCGPLDGVRMYNEITGKSPVPKLVIYCAVKTDVEPVWKIVCLFERTTDALTAKLSTVFNLPKHCLHSVWLQGPRGIRVLMCNDLVSNMEKESVYFVQLLKDSPVGYFKLLLKPYDG